jgi:hypothetical protein
MSSTSPRNFGSHRDGEGQPDARSTLVVRRVVIIAVAGDARRRAG